VGLPEIQAVFGPDWRAIRIQALLDLLVTLELVGALALPRLK